MKTNKSFREKFENFWYYYKFHTLGAAFALFVLFLIITSIVGRNAQVDFCFVDGIGVLNDDIIDTMLCSFADTVDIDTDNINMKNMTEFVNEEAAYITGAKGLTASLGTGEVDAIFVLFAGLYDSECVGDISKEFSDSELSAIGKNNFVYYDDSDVFAGFIVNNAENFQKYFGVIEEPIILQIPENSINKDNAIAFVKFLYNIK